MSATQAPPQVVLLTLTRPENSALSLHEKVAPAGCTRRRFGPRHAAEDGRAYCKHESAAPRRATRRYQAGTPLPHSTVWYGIAGDASSSLSGSSSVASTLQVPESAWPAPHASPDIMYLCTQTPGALQPLNGAIAQFADCVSHNALWRLAADDVTRSSPSFHPLHSPPMSPPSNLLVSCTAPTPDFIESVLKVAHLPIRTQVAHTFVPGSWHS